VRKGQSFEVSVEVTNSGLRSGQETVQLYVGDKATQTVLRPIKELKGFQKVKLAPGERKIVKWLLSARDLAYYDTHDQDWVTTPGEFRLFVGSSSVDIRAERSVNYATQQ
jgi:beta-glucosidase